MYNCIILINQILFSYFLLKNSNYTFFFLDQISSFTMPSLKTCLALLAEGTEELELVATVDILRRAGIVVTIASLEDKTSVKCSRGVSICPDAFLNNVLNNDYDVVMLPGGLGVKEFSQSDVVNELLKKQESANRMIAAICAGPTVLKTFSIALNKILTSHPSLKDEFLQDKNYKYSYDKVVIDGNLITSQGPGTAIEFGLTIVKQLCGRETRDNIAKSLVHH